LLNLLGCTPCKPRYEVKEKREKLRFIPEALTYFLQNERALNPGETYLFDDGQGNMFHSEPHSFSSAFGRHFEKLGFLSLGVKRIHGFRALFTTKMKNELGVDPSTIQHLLGHSDRRVTEAYFSALVAIPKNYRSPRLRTEKGLD